MLNINPAKLNKPVFQFSDLTLGYILANAKFKPMSKTDYYGYAGVEGDGYIWDHETSPTSGFTVLLDVPKTGDGSIAVEAHYYKDDRAGSEYKQWELPAAITYEGIC